jgi:hypothetical protein
MDTTTLQVFSFVVTVFALIVIVRRFRPGGRMPVTFTSPDEESAVYQVALWAAKELNIRWGGPQLRYSFALYLSSANWIWMGSIPVAELALLRPFIDLMIAGKGPPQNLPAEYDDPRPETLRRFKERCKRSGYGRRL